MGFTGQGSQWVGMGRDVLGKVEEAGKRLREVEGVLGIDGDNLLKLNLNSPSLQILTCERTSEDSISVHYMTSVQSVVIHSYCFCLHYAYH